MKILMIYPEFPITFWSYKHVTDVLGFKSLFPPLGLQTVAALLPSGWEKRLVDLNVKKLTDSDLGWADYVFISAMAVQRESAHKVVARCKKAGVKVVAGGPLFTAAPEQFEEIDCLVLNEGELTLPTFISDIEHGRLQKVYSTTNYVELSKSPVPQWDLVDLDQYMYIGIQYSRGCPYKCEFCTITSLLGFQMRVKTPEQIITELDSLYDLGWRKPIFFVDDNFIGNKKRLKNELLPLLIDWGKDKEPIQFFTQVSIDIADDNQLMQMMVEAGFRMVFIGIETPSTASLDECAKNQNKNRNLIENIKHIHASGLRVDAGFVVGFDSDKPSIFQDQIDFIQESGIPIAIVGQLQAFPGTKLHARLKEEDRLHTNDASGDNLREFTNFIPKMGNETLSNGQRQIIQYIYSPDNYIKRVKVFLNDFRLKPFTRTFKIDLKTIISFVRIVYYLGVRDSHRRSFWKLLFWTWRNHRKLIFLAISLLLFGYHHRKVKEMRYPE